ncbi:MAG TPA: tRNA lysidine(34) synthetase TilS, partial [Anaerolineales bacterium]
MDRPDGVQAPGPPMLDLIESILRDKCELDKSRPLLVGVSGGPDSLCLLGTLHEAGWQTIAAHFNHKLRPEADEDAAAVEAIARRLGIPFVGGSGDVQQHAAGGKLSIEAAARELRYRFLFAQARHHGAQAIAVGHTADDQVETVLMHFIRGAGLNGLKGMEYRTLLQEYQVPSDEGNILLVRPLLDAWRLDTVAYCESRGLRPHYDASNDSMEFLRNRVRHELIPLLESYNPRFREAVWRSAKTLLSDYEILRGTVEPIFNRALLRASDRYVVLNAVVLNDLTEGARAHMLRQALQLLIPGYDLGYDDVQRALAFINDRSQEHVDFVGGLSLMREPGAIYLTWDREIPSDAWPQLPPDQDSIDFSPSCLIPLDAGWSFAAMKLESMASVYLPPGEGIDPREAFLDADSVPDGLELRVRRPGDRFEPLGMDGHSQKLSDFFVNVKLPARARDRWPLVCAGDKVIWVPGYRPAHRYRLRHESRDVL